MALYKTDDIIEELADYVVNYEEYSANALETARYILMDTRIITLIKGTGVSCKSTTSTFDSMEN
ncbi:hypothetical protein CR203_18855 [Salipaludibacillus neizhouensis]|uniref:Uncharacterized protein n=1 Tax=Salipaludibacillus neizhouensis TaxID=885475 RepID=A0A3A9K377_9BACI|nr:hypothetical protein [Salipaludibacillus neizhouensis]RKL65718.1 hypothetical protein CR203_18855 [Salipaludibacillus neizhouensis]